MLSRRRLLASVLGRALARSSAALEWCPVMGWHEAAELAVGQSAHYERGWLGIWRLIRID